MNYFYLIFIIAILEKVNAGTLKKAPAFATPKYADSYIPAIMQVIFNGVEQFKSQQMEEAEQATTTTTTIPTTMSHSPGQHQPMTIMPTIESLSTENPLLNHETLENETEKPSHNIQLMPLNTDEKPELNAETPESNYGTPETNHEIPEEIHEMQEINQELPQIVNNDHEISIVNSNDKLETSTISLNPKPEHDNQSDSSSDESSLSSSSSSEEKEKDNNEKNKEPSIDSVVEEIYEIVKPQKRKNSSKDSSNSSASDESLDEDDDDDENDENRFTMLGEKVTQVPRPSLSTYLRRSKLPGNCSTVQQLALLYDSLSKDARNQGFSQYSGYSDEILRVLETSSDGGMGPQLKQLLEKAVERQEVTRTDAKSRIAEALTSLNDPSSQFSRDLRLLLPLRFES